MSVWRPPATIRVKVLGLAVRNGRLLCAEVRDDDGALTGLRPLGGTVEFGETRERALEREFGEELATTIRIEDEWIVLENLFEHEGVAGHEIVFVSAVTLGRSALYAKRRIRFEDGTPCVAGWFARGDLDELGVPLFPIGLMGRMREW